VAEFLFYGIDDSGRAAFSEMLSGCDREALPALARARLEIWPTVEIWEGPMCVVRLRRAPAVENEWSSTPPADRSAG
jgi:hypothetical protein